MLFLLANCAEDMKPETGYPIETSSNPDDKPGLSNPEREPWSPSTNDQLPTVTITVDDEDTYIDSIKLTDTDNVQSVTITVEDEDGNEVYSTSIAPDENGVVEVPIEADGTKIVVTFSRSEPSTPISVGPIEVTACAEPGSFSLCFINAVASGVDWIQKQSGTVK